MKQPPKNNPPANAQWQTPQLTVLTSLARETNEKTTGFTDMTSTAEGTAS